MSTTLVTPAAKPLAKKPSAKRQASKKTLAADSVATVATLNEQLVALQSRISDLLRPAYGDNFVLGFGELYDHDRNAKLLAMIVRYSVGEDIPLSAPQLKARRQMLAAWQDQKFALARSLLTLDEQFV
jgi:hypothetical protein